MPASPGRAALDGQVAVIAGAGVGIGRSSALLLAADGADVVVAARRAEPLEALAAEIRAASPGRRIIAVPTDMADVDQCRALIDAAVTQLGRVDIVVNVATRSAPRATVDNGQWDDYRAAFEVNVIGTLEVSRAAAEAMKTQGGGSIVQISALIGAVPPSPDGSLFSDKECHGGGVTDHGSRTGSIQHPSQRGRPRFHHRPEPACHVRDHRSSSWCRRR